MWFAASLLALVGCDAGFDADPSSQGPAARTEEDRPSPVADDSDVCGMSEYRDTRIIIDAFVVDDNQDYRWAPGDTLTVTGRLVNPSVDIDLWYPTAELRVFVGGQLVDTQYGNFYASFGRSSFPLEWKVVLPETAVDGQEVRIGIAATTLGCTDFPTADAQFLAGDIDTQAP